MIAIIAFIWNSFEFATKVYRRGWILTDPKFRPFPDLPVDIARKIIEMAAEEDTLTALALSLVSKEVQRWSDRYITRQLHFSSFESMVSFYRKIIHSGTPERKERLLSAVVSLRDTDFGGMLKGDKEWQYSIICDSIFSNCYNLKSCSLWAPAKGRNKQGTGVFVTDTMTRSLQSLESLSCGFYYFQMNPPVGPDPNWPYLPNVTRWDISWLSLASCRNHWSRCLDTLPSLTYLALHDGLLSYGDGLKDLSLLLKDYVDCGLFPPRIKLIAILVHEIDSSLDELREGKIDPRIMLSTYNTHFSDTPWVLVDNLTDQNLWLDEDYWHKAMKVVEDRAVWIRSQ